MKSTNDLQIGVIGTGGRGDLAGFAHKPNHGSRITACCDTDPAALEWSRKTYGKSIFTTGSYQEILSRDLDAVFICTPDFLHEEHALAALDSRIPVYLEKPLAITLAGCDRILEKSKSTRTPVYLGHNMRHMPFVLQMKSLIENGAIGEVKTVWCRHFVGHGGDFYFKDWHAERKNVTGLLLQKATHDIDVIHWLSGSYCRRVNALGALSLYDKSVHTGSPYHPERARIDLNSWPPSRSTGFNPAMDVEDISLINMELKNGILAAYQQCHFTPDYWRNYTFIGSEGRIENFGDGESGTVIKLWNRRSFGYNGAADAEFAVQAEEGFHTIADKHIVEEFLSFVRGESVPTTSPVAARYSVAAGCAATESLRNGGIPVNIKPVNSSLEKYFNTHGD